MVDAASPRVPSPRRRASSAPRVPTVSPMAPQLVSKSAHAAPSARPARGIQTRTFACPGHMARASSSQKPTSAPSVRLAPSCLTTRLAAPPLQSVAAAPWGNPIRRREAVRTTCVSCVRRERTTVTTDNRAANRAARGHGAAPRRGSLPSVPSVWRNATSPRALCEPVLQTA